MLISRSNHTQTTAYILGELAADKMIREYGLDEVDPPLDVAKL